MSEEFADSRLADLEALLLCRSYLYNLFAKLCGGEPNEKLICAMASQNTVDIARAFAGDNKTLKGFARFLEGVSVDDAFLDKAKDEFMRVFIGPASLPAQPIESPYVSNEAVLFQRNTLEVRKAYERHGYHVAERNRVPDDHVSFMCAFQAAMSEDAVRILRSGDRAGVTSVLRSAEWFGTDHMANWLPEYAKRLRRVAGAVLYPQVVEALAGFVEQDLVFLSEAAYWSEQTEDWSALCELSANDGNPESPLNKALRTLCSIGQFGLGDFRLQRMTA